MSLFMFVKANAEEDECDFFCELLTDFIFFVAGMMWRSCMDTPECSAVVIPVFFGIVILIVIVSLVLRMIYGNEYFRDRNNSYYDVPKARRVVAFGAGYMYG